MAFSVTLAVLGEATFTRLRKSEPRLLGRRYEDRLCAFAAGAAVGDTSSPAAPALPSGARSAKGTTASVPSRGARLKRASRAHGVSKCRNCCGPHVAQANVCRVKKEARQLARGWRSPPQPRREQGAKPPPPSPEAATEEEVDEMED